MFEIRVRKGVRGHSRFGTRLSVEFAWIKWKMEKQKGEGKRWKAIVTRL